MSDTRMILAGFGGQGVLFAGKVIAYAGLIEDKQLSWLPSYGPEMRGGTANCSVTLSDDPIGSPLVTTPDALIAMNQPSYDRFIDQVADGGIVVVDSGLVKDLKDRSGITTYSIPATSLAEEEGLAGLANIVLVGKLWDALHFCERKTLDEAIDKCVPPRKSALIEKNKAAIELGINA